MNGWGADEARLRRSVRRIFTVLARHLEEHADGDEQALARAAEALADAGFGADELEVAALALRSFSEAGDVAATELPPARLSQRVPSVEERECLSAEAWGYLLELRRRGSLDSRQFEAVVDRLVTSGVRPAGVELAREVAAQVVLHGDPHGGAQQGSPRSGH